MVKGTKKRQYSEADKAAAFAAYEANGQNLNRTATQCNIPLNTLKSWLRGGCHPVVVEKSQTEKRNLADMFEEVARKAAGLAVDKMDDASFQSLMTGAGIAIDKARLLRGESTANTQQTVTVEDKRKQLFDLIGLPTGAGNQESGVGKSVN